MYIKAVLFKEGKQIPTYFLIYQLPLGMRFLLLLLLEPHQFTPITYGTQV